MLYNDLKSKKIFIDTNILLSPLKNDSNITIEDFLLTFFPIRDNVIIPTHVYTEFDRNIETVYKKNKKEIENAKTEIENSLSNIRVQLGILGNPHKFNFYSQMSEIFLDLEKYQNNRVTELMLHTKKIYNYIPVIFNTTTNDNYSIKEKYVLMAEYDARCKRQIAPGFKDAEKNNENDYGDLYIWQEILDYMMAESNNDYYDAIFVTNDSKPDWRGKRSEAQLQNEYSEYVYDGQFTVMSFQEFKSFYCENFYAFETEYKKILSLLEKREWDEKNWNEFVSFVINNDLSFPFFALILSDVMMTKLRNLIEPYKNELLKIGIWFLNLSKRGELSLSCAGINDIGSLFGSSISELIKTNCFGKMGLSEISERRELLNNLLGPFEQSLDSYSCKEYESIKNKVQFD